jgi:3-isopropylmalate/(R)-2-methylmalate dehydratase small subunit
MSKIVSISGKAVPVPGNDIDTDRIIPARYLKEITFSRMGEYPFFDERFNADGSKKGHPFDQPQHDGAAILLGQANFGCGSSREHAPQALNRWGVKAIVAESFAEIFAGNCVMLGVPAVTAAKADIDALFAKAKAEPATLFTLDLESLTISGGGLKASVSLAAPRRKALLEGTWDSTGLLLANASATAATAARLPYMSGYAG